MLKELSHDLSPRSRLLRGLLLSLSLSILFLSPVAFSADSGEIPDDMVEWVLAEDALFQTSTIGALMSGVYDGDVTIGQLKKQGDLGIGIGNQADGELIALDGEYYRIRTDGMVYAMEDSDLIPFASVVKFQPELAYYNIKELTFEQLKKRIDDIVKAPNYIFAFKIEGTFSYMRTRSIPKQEKPYIPLTEVAKQQSEFEMTDVEGTMLGFYCPAFINGINVTGYHFHFITKDRKAGGHVLDCTIGLVDINIDYKFGFNMVIPSSNEFSNADLSVEGLDDVEKPKSSLRYYQQLK